MSATTTRPTSPENVRKESRYTARAHATLHLEFAATARRNYRDGWRKGSFGWWFRSIRIAYRERVTARDWAPLP